MFRRDTRKCIQHLGNRNHYTYILFIGDSRIRALYDNVVKLVANVTQSKPNKDKNAHFKDDDIKLNLVRNVYPAFKVKR